MVGSLTLAALRSKLRGLGCCVARYEPWLLLVAAPFLLFPGRWTPLFFALLVLSWIGDWLAFGRPFVATPANMPLACLVVMACIGCLVSVDPSASAASLWRIMLGVACFYALANVSRRPEQQRWLPIGVTLVGLATAALALLGSDWQAVRLLPLANFYDHLPSLLRDFQDHSSFHPRVMGLALAAWLPVPLALLWFGRGGRGRVWAGLATAAMTLALLLTQSLQGAAGVACALFFLAACWNRRLALCVFTVLGVPCAGWLAVSWRPVAQSLLSVKHPLGIAVALRLDMWSRALAMIRDMPYTGIGLDSFPVIQSSFYPGVIIGPETHAHNLYLQLALDLGLPGLLAFLWLLFSLGKSAHRACRRIENPDLRALLLGAAGGVLAVLASGTLDTLWPAKPTVLLWLLLGLVAALSASGRDVGSPRPGKGLAGWLARTLLPVALLLFLTPGLILDRAAPRANGVSWRAHQMLLQIESGEEVDGADLVRVANDLRSMSEARGANPHTNDALGRTLAWLGDYPEAVQAFRRRVDIDGVDPVGRYYPSAHLLSLLEPPGIRDRWGELIHIYSQWKSRFPQRAEVYVMIALVRAANQGDPVAAAAILREGLARSAEPRGLLEYGLSVVDNRSMAQRIGLGASQ